MGNPRYLKVAEQIKVIVAELLERRIKDPRLGFVTITEVRLSGDGREGTVFYTVFGPESERAGTAAALASAAGLIRSTVGKQLGMKFTPKLDFVLDAIPDTARDLEELLERARAADAEVAQQRQGAAFAADPNPYKTEDE